MSVPTDHPYNFDPTYGFGDDDLRALTPPPAPADFDGFWRKRYAKARSVDPEPRLSDSAP